MLFKDIAAKDTTEPGESSSLAPIKENQIRFQDSLNGSVATDLVSIVPVMDMSLTASTETALAPPLTPSSSKARDGVDPLPPSVATTSLSLPPHGPAPLLPARSSLSKENSAYITEAVNPQTIGEDLSLVPKGLEAVSESEAISTTDASQPPVTAGLLQDEPGW